MANACSEPSSSNMRELTCHWYIVNSVVVYAVLFSKLGKCLSWAAGCQKNSIWKMIDSSPMVKPSQYFSLLQ